MIAFQIKGHDCYIDDCDTDLLRGAQWYLHKLKKSRTIYLRRDEWSNNKRQSRPYLHRVVLSRMLGRVLLRHEEVDHIDLNGMNNQRSNLRLANKNQNKANKPAQSNNTTGYKGVSRKHHRFQAILNVNKQRIHLGYYDTAEEAHKAYVEGAKKHLGEFARW